MARRYFDLKWRWRAADVVEALLPVQALVMPAELARVDALDEDRFFAPYREFFHATIGRPSIPIETYLRLMFLKYRYRLGFETLCREVTDSITWQRFCSFASPSVGGCRTRRR